MGAGVAKEIAPLIPMVMSALPALIQGFQSTRSIENNKEDKKIEEVLERLQRDRNDIDQILQNQAQLQRTYEALIQLMNRLENGCQENWQENRNGSQTGAKLRIELDLPDNAEEREEALRNFWLTLQRMGSTNYQEGQATGLANEVQFQNGGSVQREICSLNASAPPVCREDSRSDDDDDEKLKQCFACGICTQIYNDEERRPILLPDCGHTFCKECLVKSFRRKRNCPACRNYCSSDIENLPVNYTVLEFLNKEMEMGCKAKKKIGWNGDNDLSYEDQMKIAMQLSLEENQRNEDYLLAKRLQEEEERLMRFCHHEDSEKKGRRYVGVSCDVRGERLGNREDNRTNCLESNYSSDNDEMCLEEQENNEMKRKESRDVENGIPFERVYSSSDGAESRNTRYAHVYRLLEDLKDDDDDDCMDSCSRPPTIDDEESQRRKQDREDSDSDSLSLYEREKRSLLERAARTHEENKAKRRQRRMLKEQEELDLVIAVSMSMAEMETRQDI